MSQRILIVDDVPQNLYMLRVLLEGHGWEVAEASHGVEALASARAEPPQVVVTDLLMPEMDGFALCREWMRDEALRSIPLIVYTATYTASKDRQLALDLGAAGFFVKPTEPEALVEAILKVVASAPAGAEGGGGSAALADADFYTRYSERLREKLDRKVMRLGRTEQALVDYVTRCEGILDNSPSAIVSIDADLKIRSWNFAAERLFGYTEIEALGQPLSLVVPPDRAEESRRVLAELNRRRESTVFETQRRRKDGTLVDVSISLSFLGPQIGVLGVISDLSAEREAAAEKRRLEAQVAQADRLASMGMLAAGVAHEINNPLTHVLYNLESLAAYLPALVEAYQGLHRRLTEHLDQPTLDKVVGPTFDELPPGRVADLPERFTDALLGTRRIHDIARGLSSFSRVEEDIVAPVNLVQVVEVATKMACNEIKYRARLVKDLAPVPAVAASDGRLSQVFLNLLINAAQAIKEGDREHHEIRVRTWPDGDQVCASVEDNGEGIQPDHKDQLFEPFFTTKRPGEGSGLGLAISRNIIEGYGGSIDVESEHGACTRFTIRLPAHTQAPARAAAPSPSPPPPPASRRVLVIDDDERIRAAMIRMLAEHDLVEAASGEEAKELLEQDQAFDVIVCDVMMSELSGVALHQWLAETHPDLAKRLVFVTGGAFTSSARQYLSRVDNVRLEKPFRTAELKRIIGELELRSRGGDQ